jgi:hypothetical protein
VSVLFAPAAVAARRAATTALRIVNRFVMARALRARTGVWAADR